MNGNYNTVAQLTWISRFHARRTRQGIATTIEQSASVWIAKYAAIWRVKYGKQIM